MIVPHHVYLALSDLEQKVKDLKKEAGTITPENFARYALAAGVRA